MAIDMSQFYQVFFGEAAEHLASIENLLVSMDPNAPDAEDLNALFRAAHSIKGSSATFGFGDMADVTHVMETLLDEVRKQQRPLTVEIVDACLGARDVLRNLLAAHMGEEDADESAAATATARLQSLCDRDDVAAATPQPAAGAVRAARYEIRFRPDAACRERPELIDNLIEELGRLGRVLDVHRAPAGSGEPYSLSIDTGAAADALREVADFVAESGSVSVQPAVHETPAAYGLFDTPADDRAGADECYGFFEPLPEVPAAAVGEDAAYGLFEQPAASAAADEAYGFFDPPAAPRIVGERQESVAPDGSYGLFLPLQPSAADGDEEAPDGSYGLFAAASTSPTPAGLVAEPGVHAAPAGGDPSATQRKSAAARGGADSSIRVSVEKVDQMINLVGELVITQAMLTQSAAGLDPAVYERLMDGLVQLERNTRDLQESVMSIRMLPISVVFSRFPRVVRDVSKKLGKQVELKTSGEATELDKGLIERISDPLTHLIRNSLDHGIEASERRLACGKPEAGTITLRAYQQSGNIVIEVGDDGAGLDRDRILVKARERGLAVSDAMSDAEVWQLIFEPGFSTAEQVTDVSGRGVGMDVVKRNIASLGGRIEIESLAGVGTRMTVRLPLTLAILDGMSVGVGRETYIVPLDYVVESLQPGAGMMRSVSGVERLIQVRGEYLPVVCLHECFGIEGACTDWQQGIVVILEADGAKAALFVDQLIGQHQVVIKSLEANYRRVPGVSGATIMGDGRVALILDPAALVGQSRRPMPAAA